MKCEVCGYVWTEDKLDEIPHSREWRAIIEAGEGCPECYGRPSRQSPGIWIETSCCVFIDDNEALIEVKIPEELRNLFDLASKQVEVKMDE